MMDKQQMLQGEHILALDTATSMLTVSLLTGDQVVAEHHWQAGQQSSMMLVPAIQSIMQKHGWTGDNLDLIAVGKGPGSYTGVRVAITAAKTLAWAWQKPIVAISSLHALALSGLERCWQRQLQLYTAGDRIIPLMDARRGRVYTACFTLEGEGVGHGCLSLQREQTDGVRLFYQLVEEIQQAMQADATLFYPLHTSIWFIGEVGAQREAIEELQRQFGKRIQSVACPLNSHWIGILGRRAWHRGEDINMYRIEPNYTQVAEAEARQLAKEQAVANANKQV